MLIHFELGERQVAQEEDLGATSVVLLSGMFELRKHVVPQHKWVKSTKRSDERKGMRTMADPKVLLAALAAFAAGLLLIGCISLDWRFFVASGLTSLAIIVIGIKAGGWRALNPFDRGH
jgi:hypothetical protein